jgi:hypothetical protein
VIFMAGPGHGAWRLGPRVSRGNLLGNLSREERG